MVENRRAVITFITRNAQKAAEVERLLGFPVEHETVSGEEIQAIDLRPVVFEKAAHAYAVHRRPLLVEDTGLAFSAMNGFPGALIKWLLQSLGSDGICRLLHAETDRRACATTVFGYHDGTTCHIFAGTVTGSIPDTPRGSLGFGWDAIFQPHGSRRTFAEMTAEEKDRFSMRRLALEQLRDSGLVRIV